MILIKKLNVESLSCSAILLFFALHSVQSVRRMADLGGKICERFRLVGQNCPRDGLELGGQIVIHFTPGQLNQLGHLDRRVNLLH